MKVLKKDTFREIKRSFGRFLAILLIVACGVGVFVGIKSTAPSMYKTADQYFKEQSLYDIEVLSTVGFDKDDLAAVKKIEEVDKAVLSYSADVMVHFDDGDLVYKIMALPNGNEDQINVPLLEEGRLPEESNECVVGYNQDRYKIGDTININPDAGDAKADDFLKQRVYTVVGKARMPQFFSAMCGSSSIGNGTIESFILVNADNFLYERYTEMYVTLKCHQQGISAFDEQYDVIIDRVKNNLQNEVGEERKRVFLNQITTAEGQLAQAQAQAAKEFSAAEAELQSAAAQIADGELELSVGWKEYAQKKAQAEAEIAAGQEKINEGQEQYDAYYALLQSVQSAVDRLRERFPDIEQLDIYKQYQAQMAQYAVELDASKAEIEEGKAQIAQAQVLTDQALEEACSKLYKGENELSSAKNQYESGFAAYNLAVQETEKQLSEGQNRIQNIKAQMGDIKSGMWYVFSRDDVMTNYSGFASDAGRIDSIADIFPIFFLMVAALVCVTTMSRMIDEQRLQIGTYKALGYTKREIMFKYIIYAVAAASIGCIFGPIMGVLILPRVIFGAYTQLYSLPFFKIEIPWLMYLVAVIVAMACTVLVSWFCCHRELKATTASLMRPKAPKIGKQIFLERIPFIWKRFSFFQKLTARNLIRYKTRFIMTVVGIAGCMALILAGFGLDNAISPIVELQYQELGHYDITIYLSNSYLENELVDLKKVLEDDKRISGYELISSVDVTAWNKDHSKSEDSYTSYIIPRDPENYKHFFTFRDPDSKENLNLPNDGVLINPKLAETLGIKVGDSLIIEIDKKEYEVKVSGLAENYVLDSIYISPEYYEKVVGKDLRFNSIIAIGSESMGEIDVFNRDLLSRSNQVAYAFSMMNMKDQISDTMNSLHMVVLVMILCAGILAFIVLYNLTNINISERVREIATVKVLGFNKKEVNNYVFRENIILSVFGVILGLVLGYGLAQLLISTVETDMVTFNRSIYWTSYLYSAGITMLFTIIVNFSMKRTIKKINMVESLKAVE